VSGRPNSALAGVKHVDRYAKSADDEQVFGLIFGAQALGRIYGSTPSIPATSCAVSSQEPSSITMICLCA